MLCSKILYNYIDLGLLDIKNTDLLIKLRRNTKPPRVKKHKKNLCTSIAEGPIYGLMSIFWTQKVKLFYAAPLANNSH